MRRLYPLFFLLLFFTSCQQSTPLSLNDLTYHDSPTWAGSTWAGSGASLTSSRDIISKSVTSAAGTTISYLNMQNGTYTLTLNTNGTFTFVLTSVYDANNWPNSLVSDKYLYSTSSSSYAPPIFTSPFVGTEYKDLSNTTVSFVNGIFYSGAPDFSLASISSTSTTVQGQTVFPVAFPPTAAAAIAEAAKTFSVQTITGTYTLISNTTNPTNKTTTPILTSTSGTTVITAYNTTTGAVSSTTTNSETYIASTNPLRSLSFLAYKTPNSSGVSSYTCIYYPRVSFGITSVMLYMQ